MIVTKTLSAGNNTIGLTATTANGCSNLDKVTVQGAVAAPTFSPVAGTYSSAQSVTISSATSGATIRYTIDGSTPSATVGTVYSAPVNIAVTTTLKAIAYKSGMTDSTVTTGVYTISALFSDNFEDGVADGWTVTAGTWSVVTDGTKVYKNSATTGDAWSSAGSVWTNYSVEAKAKAITFGGTFSQFSLFGRWTDSSNHYYVRLGNGNTLSLRKKVGGTVTTLATKTFTVTTGTWYTVKLTLSGTSPDRLRQWHATTDRYRQCVDQRQDRGGGVRHQRRVRRRGRNLSVISNIMPAVTRAAGMICPRFERMPAYSTSSRRCRHSG